MSKRVTVGVWLLTAETWCSRVMRTWRRSRTPGSLILGLVDQRALVDVEFARREELVLVAREVVAAAEQRVRLAQRCRELHAEPRVGRVELGGVMSVAGFQGAAPVGGERRDEAPRGRALGQNLEEAGGHVGGGGHGRTVAAASSDEPESAFRCVSVRASRCSP